MIQKTADQKIQEKDVKNYNHDQRTWMPLFHVFDVREVKPLKKVSQDCEDIF